jgi:molybdenum cofactor biosynthesis protein MoaC
MVNITHKSNTLREAIAQARVTVSTQGTIDAIVNKKIPKGDIFEFARVAGLFGIKKTSELIPDCHPLPIEFSSISYEIDGLSIIISVEVHTIYKTGVEVEAMHGASIVALTMYDMLKPIDKGVFISEIKLHKKKGGKSDIKNIPTELKAALIVCSNSVSKGLKEDTSGLRAVEKLDKFNITLVAHQVIPDDKALIKDKALFFSKEQPVDLILFAGGTGLGPYDVTPDAIQPLLTREIPGIMEAARKYGQDRINTAMLSRGVAGFIDRTLVITLPGSPKGTVETIDALFPHILHVFKIIDGARHD